jgi:HAD superfamily hydrolase (TIGR01509 family)
MLNKPVKAALFDMDGLLLDTEAVYIRAYRAAAETFEVEMPLALCHAMVGSTGPRREGIIQDHYGPRFDAARFQLCFREHAQAMMEDGIPVKPGARELLAYLGDRGLPLAIATSARAVTVDRHLGRAGLRHHFSAIATRHDVERTKPHPDVYLEAARRLGVAPQHCVAFEDSNVGLTAAHAAGTMAIMVPDIVPPTEESRAKCVTVLPDLHAALALLREHMVQQSQ